MDLIVVWEPRGETYPSEQIKEAHAHHRPPCILPWLGYMCQSGRTGVGEGGSTITLKATIKMK